MTTSSSSPTTPGRAAGPPLLPAPGSRRCRQLRLGRRRPPVSLALSALSFRSLYPHMFSRAYINFKNQEDIVLFRDRFDGYVFVDHKGK